MIDPELNCALFNWMREQSGVRFQSHVTGIYPGRAVLFLRFILISWDTICLYTRLEHYPAQGIPYHGKIIINADLQVVQRIQIYKNIPRF